MKTFVLIAVGALSLAAPLSSAFAQAAPENRPSTTMNRDGGANNGNTGKATGPATVTGRSSSDAAVGAGSSDMTAAPGTGAGGPPAAASTDMNRDGGHSQ